MLGFFVYTKNRTQIMKKRTDQSNLTIPPLNDACRKRLRQLRERLGFSRPEFSDKLGIPATTLKNYELN